MYIMSVPMNLHTHDVHDRNYTPIPLPTPSIANIWYAVSKEKGHSVQSLISWLISYHVWIYRQDELQWNLINYKFFELFQNSPCILAKKVV